MNLLRSVSLVSLACAALSARATIVDFEDLAGTGTKDGYITLYGPTVVSGGFQFASERLASIGPGGPQAVDYTGSIALFDTYGGGAITMSRVGGGAFTLLGIDLANLNAIGEPQGSTITFSGILRGGGAVSQTFTVATGNGLQSFVFSGFADVTSVTWGQEPNFHQFDNVVAEAAVPGPIAALPFAVLALKRRKRA